MRRRWVIGIFILMIGLSAVAAVRNRSESAKPDFHSTSTVSKYKEMQIQNLQTNLPVQRIDSIGSTNFLKAQLNSDPTIKIIHHNRQDKSHYYDHEVIVDFKKAPDKTGLAKILRDINGVIKQKLDTTYIFKSEIKSPEELVRFFNQDENVSFAEPHYIYLKNEVNDTYYLPYQWNLPAIATEDGWNITQGSKDIKIAVVDSGVDLHHPDLSHRLQPGYNAIDHSNNADDDNGHGTHVAGIIAADTNNHKGVAGITWLNPIIPVKVLDSKGSGGSFDVAQGIRWATDHGAKVINLSLGNYQTSAVMEKAIRYAQKKDVVVVSAAGNDNSGQPSYPSAYPDVIGVAAVDYHGKRAPFSNYGNYVDVAAPGVDIASTYFHGQYASLSGTSMAAPHVTALAALIRSIDPTLKNKEVAGIITGTTQKNGRTGPDLYYGNGIIDNVRALQYTAKRKNPLGATNNWFNPFKNK